jgi:hypothetical protein
VWEGEAVKLSPIPIFEFCEKSNIPVAEIEATCLFNINELNPYFNIKPGLILSRNAISIDEKDNLYFLDFNNHRVLKFDMRGNFLGQIGSIGQGNKDLFYPQGIFIHQNSVYVLDDSGSKLKMYSQEGDFLSCLEIDDKVNVKSFFVTKNLIILNALHKKNFNKTKPISIYTKKFTKINEIGKIVVTPSSTASSVFNEMFVVFYDNSIYGCLKTLPIIFRNNVNGIEIVYKDLREMNIKEILTIENQGKKRGVDSPESIKDNNRIRSMIYCDGFGISGNGDIYYALNYDRARRGLILHMNSEGELIEKIILKVNDEQPRIERILIRKNETFALLNKNNNFLFCKF